MTAPFINIDKKESCPMADHEVNEFLLREDPDIDNDAEYLGSASFPDRTFWVWQYTASDEATCQVVVIKFSDGTFEIGTGRSQLESFTLEGFAEELYSATRA